MSLRRRPPSCLFPRPAASFELDAGPGRWSFPSEDASARASASSCLGHPRTLTTEPVADLHATCPPDLTSGIQCTSTRGRHRSSCLRAQDAVQRRDRIGQADLPAAPLPPVPHLSCLATCSSQLRLVSSGHRAFPQPGDAGYSGQTLAVSQPAPPVPACLGLSSKPS